MIHTALLCEATPVIERYGLVRCPAFSPGRLYKGDQIEMLVGGVGSARTTASIRAWRACGSFEPGDSLLTIGVCGARPGIPRGSAFSISEIEDAASGERFGLPDWRELGLQPGTLTTVARPQLAPAPDGMMLVDMEAAACMRALSHTRLHRIYCVKVVSDNMDGEPLGRAEAAALIRTALAAVAPKLPAPRAS